MYARVGDRLVVSDDPARSALIIGVPHQDGSPPYVVKWLADGHIAMVSPSAFARVIPAEPPGAEAEDSFPQANQDRRASKSAT
jgi:Domain of unknown function (DUF1918)